MCDPFPRVPGLLWLVAMFACVAPVHAQRSLPSGVTAVEGQFTVEQRERVAGFWETWSERMREASTEADLVDARRRLVEPLRRPGVTEAFRQQYAAIGLSPLRRLVASDTPGVRFNALIVLAHARRSLAAEIATPMLDDDHVAVRYWAGKAIALGLDDDGPATLDPGQRATLRQALRAAVIAEHHGPVREQMYRALAQLDSTDARQALLSALEANLARYVEAGVTRDLSAEVDALTQLRVALSANRMRSEAVKRQLIVVAAKYLQLAQRTVERDQINPTTYTPLVNLVNILELILNRAVNDFDESGPRPALHEPFRNERFDDFRLNASDWILTLPELDLQIESRQLTLTGDNGNEGGGE